VGNNRIFSNGGAEIDIEVLSHYFNLLIILAKLWAGLAWKGQSIYSPILVSS